MNAFLEHIYYQIFVVPNVIIIIVLFNSWFRQKRFFNNSNIMIDWYISRLYMLNNWTLSNTINNNILTFENDLVDQIPEVENFQPSSIPEITKIITNLKQSNSVGLDNIPTTILKSNINILAPILSNLINNSLAMRFFPKSPKRAKILPMFKNKDKPDITNYRPIYILPVFSKVYEKDFYNNSIIISLLITYYHHVIWFQIWCKHRTRSIEIFWWYSKIVWSEESCNCNIYGSQ